MFFKGFWLQRPLKKASRGPRWLPKGTQKIQDPKKLESNIETKKYKKMEPILEPTLKPKHSKINQKKTILGPPSPASQGSK